jgi:RHS repeat-associated protein
VLCPGHNLDDTEGCFATRISLDIEGNQRDVRDALNRVVMRYDYDLLGNRIHQASMEAGERWQLGDSTGKPIRAWDSRSFVRRMTYDSLRRPTGLFVTEEGTERLAESTVYGEAQGDGTNHRGRVFQVFDGAGVITNVAYDFKGNLLENRRDLLPNYRRSVDWQQNPAATDGTFTSTTTFDALNRPLTVTSPDGSVYRPTFNEANLLDKVDVQLRGAGTVTAFVTNIDYNAKGQRERIEYGNSATTTYDYDPLTFRLSRMKTTRPPNADATASQLFRDTSIVQDLRYSYDPVGNITRIEDVALRTVSRDGRSIEPVSAYTYDAVYRLIEAIGREHIGQNAFDINPPNGNNRDFPFLGHRAHPNDLQALRNYTERYEYDSVGNFVELAHRANGSGWTRRYEYQENSLLETGEKSNRLTSTAVGNGLNQVEPYTHDAHGNMTSMPHLAAMVWDLKDQLRQADLGGGGTAYYVYDSAGQRVRKVIASQNGTRQKERLYLGGFEIYREYDGDAISLERESLHVMDDKQRIALVETQTIQNGNEVTSPTAIQRYQLGNHLGSASLELDEVGALISYEEYHSYGTTAFQAGRSAAEVSLKRYRYTGKERDEESGLHYFEARYCASWLGRWLSPDPAGLQDGPDVYVHCRCNPTTYRDEDGHATRKAVPAEADLFVAVLEARYCCYVEILSTSFPNQRQLVGKAADDLLKRDLAFAIGSDTFQSNFRLTRKSKRNADVALFDGQLLIEFALSRGVHGTPNQPGSDRKMKDMQSHADTGATAYSVGAEGRWHRNSAEYTPEQLLKLGNYATRVGDMPPPGIPAATTMRRYDRRASPSRTTTEQAGRWRNQSYAQRLNTVGNGVAVLAAGAEWLNQTSINYATACAIEKARPVLERNLLSNPGLGVLITSVTSVPNFAVEVAPEKFEYIEFTYAASREEALANYNKASRLRDGSYQPRIHHLQWIPSLEQQLPTPRQ